LKLSPQRQFDPECLSCHVTGWDAEKYFPFASGFLGAKQESLHGNGCENCHGPGDKHVAAERAKGTDTEQRDKLRQAMRLTQAEARKQTCLKCHDIDNSPDYNWEVYWPQVEHQGKD
jgi:Cytochrome c554 and c-prime